VVSELGLIALKVMKKLAEYTAKFLGKAIKEVEKQMEQTKAEKVSPEVREAAKLLKEKVQDAEFVYR